MDTTSVARWICSTGSGRSPARRTCAAGNGVTSGNKPAATPCSPSARNQRDRIRWPFRPMAVGWRLARIAQGGLSVWDLRTRQELIRLAESDEECPRRLFAHRTAAGVHQLHLFCFRARSEFTLAASGIPTTRQMIAEFPLDNACMGLAFAQDGRTLVTSTLRRPNHPLAMPEGTKLASYPSEQVWPGRNSAGFAATRTCTWRLTRMTGGQDSRH